VLLARESEEVVTNVLERLETTHALRVLACLPKERAQQLARTEALLGVMSGMLMGLTAGAPSSGMACSMAAP
jgi:hypothetical protein